MAGSAGTEWMLGRVTGMAHNRAEVFDREGRSRLMVLNDTATIKWARTLNEVSEATVEVAVPSEGTARSACCGDLGRLSTWAHTLVIYRGEDRVWEGPIRSLSWKPSTVTIGATDVMGWLGKRRTRTSRLFEEPAASPVMTEADWSIRRGFAPDNPNVIQHLTAAIDPAADQYPVNRDVQVNGGTHLDDVGTLVDGGLRWTVVGRRIVLFNAAIDLGTTASLYPENHLLADVEVVEDGDSAATSVTARDDEQHSATVAQSASSATMLWYGLLESLVSTGPGAAGATSLRSVASAEMRRSNPVPVQLKIPDGATLRPDAPFPIHQLVPGVLVPVVSRGTCREVVGTMRLTAVEVNQTSEGETVGITVGTLEGSE